MSNATLARAFQAAYGFPVRVADITFSSTADAARTTLSASWKADGTLASSMNATQVNAGEGHIMIHSRVLWRNGNGTVRWDLQKDEAYGEPLVLVPSVMNPPMLDAQLGLDPFPGRGQAEPHATAKTTLTRYADAACKEPRPG